MPIQVTEKAAKEVKRIINETQQSSIPADMMPAFKALEANLGRLPTLTEMAQKLGVPEEEIKTKLGENAVVAFNPIHLRLSVIGGGCSGFQNKLQLDPIVNKARDEVFEAHGVPVAIDKRSLMYLVGATVDFYDELNRHGFHISNPNAKSTCGCGSSYSM